MKINTLLFGAGPGAKFFMQKNSDNRNFLAILDNDPLKKGSAFEGVTVDSVTAIEDFSYDEIVITTQWALTVKEQLVNELLVDESLIVIPDKNQLKEDVLPFNDKGSRQLAREIVLSVNRIAKEMEVPIVIDFGTLLGLVRDNDIIEWDDDVDFAAPQKSAELVEDVLKIFIKSRPDITWILEKVQDVSLQTTSIQLKFTDFSGKYIPFISSVAMRKNVKGCSIHLPSLGMWYAPEFHFDSLTLLKWRGEDIQAPEDYLGYLDFQYGDWQTPKKNIKFSDYANLQEVEFSQVKTANYHLIRTDFNVGGGMND